MDTDRYSLKSALTLSAAIHLAVFGFLFLKWIFFPSAPMTFIPTLRVDMVGLPDVLKKDLSRLEHLPLPKEEAPALPKKAEPKADVEPTSSKDILFKPKKVKSLPSEKKVENQMKSALNRIKALDKIKDDDDTPKSTSETAVIRGNKISPGTSLSGEAKEAIETSYFEKVRDQLLEVWTLPPWLARQNLEAQIQVTINGVGVVTGLRFIKPSGNAQFDEAVKAAISQAQPLPKPPKDILGLVGSQGILIGFPL